MTTTRIPGSKSITNRALLLAAAARGRSRLRAPLVSDDTVAFREALRALGVRISVRGADWDVDGLGGAPRTDAGIWCADAGTAARFLPPLVAAGTGSYRVDGSAQLRARPLGPLTSALTELGAEVESGPGGGLPLRITARGLGGGGLRLDSSTSSQYLTGLLLSAPLMRTPLTIDADGLVSRPYIDMTLSLMRSFGADVTQDDTGRLRVATGGYRGIRLHIEPDASTASYLFAAAAVTGTTVTVPHLGKTSLQGDLRFTEVLARTGAHVAVGPDATTVTGTGPLRGGFDVDMGDISDTFMTLAAIAPLADAPITVRGIEHARYKESDRIDAVAKNLRAGGIRVDEGPDRLTVHPGPMAPTRIDCRRDHRIAMAFSVLGLRTHGITLDDPECVAKTFPDFHQELRRVFGATD
ncbi:3-phosphoshikimate 1-carboxyvinyltransferase [Streptomyces sp. NPDC102467]|uniref:3-phosphoshikimate 1-carboxyvinyltransferase n=1 Tax=Streptomyces sp. NPDC102467 TaxID=3366179 RepID=UPI00381B9180